MGKSAARAARGCFKTRDRAGGNRSGRRKRPKVHDEEVAQGLVRCGPRHARPCECAVRASRRGSDASLREVEVPSGPGARLESEEAASCSRPRKALGPQLPRWLREAFTGLGADAGAPFSWAPSPVLYREPLASTEPSRSNRLTRRPHAGRRAVVGISPIRSSSAPSRRWYRSSPLSRRRKSDPAGAQFRCT